jgi:hypothetical protein
LVPHPDDVDDKTEEKNNRCRERCEIDDAILPELAPE